MTWIKIQAQDVWLFRDGKPFSAGQDHSAIGMFPPTPFTVQGAFRQKISMQLGVNLRDYKRASSGEKAPENAFDAVEAIGKHGDLNDTGRFRLDGVYVAQTTEQGTSPLLSVPADLFYHDDKKDFIISKPTEHLISDLEDSLIFPKVIEGYENQPNHYLTVDDFNRYLSDKLPERMISSGDIYDTESRFGVSTDAYKSYAEEGQLYQIQFVRPKENISLLANVQGIKDEFLEGSLQLGGEGRQADATIINDVSLPTQPSTVTGKFKVIFLTPTYLVGGWRPQDKDWSKLFGDAVVLRSASLYRPLKIGGWSNAKGTARAMYHYVAPGSVYYFETNKTITLPNFLSENPPNIHANSVGLGRYVTAQW